MPKHWNKIQLKKLCHKIGDGLHGTPNYDEESDFYFINGNNLKNGKIEIAKETKTVDEDDFNKNYISLNSNTLLLSINGTLGNMAFYNNEKIMLGKSAAYLNFKTNINRFYYYYFQLPEILKYFYDVATGSTIKNLSLKSIQDFEVPFPEEKEWTSIAKVLSDLDAKIEVNNRINEELESLAKTIYDYWFVQFDFPDGEGKPYKSSGGKMVYNEEVKREIPEGWEVKKLSDFVNCYDSLRKPLSKQQREDFVGDIPYYGATGIMGFVKEFLFEKDLILLAEDGSVMDENGFPILQYIYGKSWVNNHAHVLEPKNLRSYDFLRLHLSKIHVIKIMTGSIQKKITQENLMKKVFFFPPEEILASFDKKLKPIRQKIKNIEFQNQELSALRDWLLPMLMNGQVRVV